MPKKNPPMTVSQALAALGLDSSATQAQIRRRYRSLMRTHHPDVGGDAAVAARLNEAREVLAHYKPRTSRGGGRETWTPPTPPPNLDYVNDLMFDLPDGITEAFWARTRGDVRAHIHITLDDGTLLSIRGGDSAYSEPRNGPPPYSAFEVGTQGDLIPEFSGYGDGSDEMLREAAESGDWVVYAWVPSALVEAVIRSRGFTQHDPRIKRLQAAKKQVKSKPKKNPRSVISKYLKGL